MMRDLIGPLFQVGGEIVKEVAFTAIRQSYLSRSVVSPSPGDTPGAGKLEGCPYCAVAKTLGVAWFYLHRAPRRTNFSRIYGELARTQVTDAIAILDRMPGIPDNPTMRLTESLVRLEVALSRPISSPDYSELAATVRDIMNADLDLAERFNSSASMGDELAARIDERLARLDHTEPATPESQVIEGEARVIE